LNILEQLERSQITTKILEVIHYLEDDPNYTREDAKQDLLGLLEAQGMVFDKRSD